MPLVLGIESSCDECSVSVVEGEGARVLSLATHSQVKLHQPYGGVVPEIASRNHLETIHPMIDEALARAGTNLGSIDVIAVTNRPGLVGALLVGVTTAKAIAYALKKPLVAVHHLEGHAVSAFLDTPGLAQKLGYPALIAIVSGGHTCLVVAPGQPQTWPEDLLASGLVGRSRDDAAGEAFDKIAKVLGFPYPGGKFIDELARSGNPKKYHFPRALSRKETLDFSFSGLKTAAAMEIEKIRKQGQLENEKADLCASVQEAIVDALWIKIKLALDRNRCGSLILVGGVSANSRLREKLMGECHVPTVFPKSEYCTDNGAMIALAGFFRYAQGRELGKNALLGLSALPSARY